MDSTMTVKDLPFKNAECQEQISSTKTFQKYLFAFFLAVLCSILVLQIWDFKWLYIPFNYCGDTRYCGDSLYHSTIVKSIITTGWYLIDPLLGAPNGYSLEDFPISEGLHCLIIKIISCFSSNWALVYNIFFLLGFPLIAISALFVFQRLGLCYP